MSSTQAPPDQSHPPQTPEAGPSPESWSRSDLLTLYKSALEEYRYTVNLNWDRQKFFVGLNLTVTGVVATLMKLDAKPAFMWGMGLFLLAAASVAWLGIRVVETGHQYYRNSREHFRHAETLLELSQIKLTLQTTEGMRGAKATKRLKIKTATQVVLGVLMSLDVLGALYAFSR